MDNKNFPEKSEFLFYTTEDGKTRVQVRLLDDTSSFFRIEVQDYASE